MAKRRSGYSKNIGLPPGTIRLPEGDAEIQPWVHWTRYDSNDVLFDSYTDAKNISLERGQKEVEWLDIEGIGDAEFFRSLGNLFSIHPLAVEDLLNIDHWPKYENFQDYGIFIFKGFAFNQKNLQLETEHIAMVLQGHLVITLQERKTDFLKEVRERIQNRRGKVRTQKSDYLAYCILDYVVDHYFALVENLREHIHETEKEAIANPHLRNVEHLFRLKRQLSGFLRQVRAQREAILSVQRDASSFIHKSTLVYFHDLLDHLTFVIEASNGLMEHIDSITNLFFSLDGQRLNNLMKVLAIISAIFLPLNLVVGFYGMNLKGLPGESSGSTVWLVVGLLLAVCMGLLGLFKYRRWLD